MSISRSHCSLRRDENGTWFIKDTSSFGIKINNQLIGKDKERVLNKDDIVQLDLVGDFKYKFVVEEQTNYKRKHDSDTEESETSQKKIHIDQSQNNNTPVTIKYVYISSILMKFQPVGIIFRILMKRLTI